MKSLTFGRKPVPAATNRRIALYEVPSLAILVALGWVTFVSATRPDLLSLAHSGVLGTVITTASLLIACGAAYVALTEFLLYGLFSSLCIGLAFLVFAGGHIGLKLLPLLGGWENHVSWAPFGWSIEDAIAGFLLVTAGVMVNRDVSLARRGDTLKSGMISVAVLALLVTAAVYAGGSRQAPEAGRTAAALLDALLFFAASFLFWKESKRSTRPWFFWLSVSLVLAAFAEFQYAIHQYSITVVQAGDVLRLMFFTAILFALAAEWSHNYRRLRWQARELTALHAFTSAPNVHDVSSVVQHIEKIATETLRATAKVLLAQREPDYFENGFSADPAGLEVLDKSHSVHATNGSDSAKVTLGVPLQSGERRLGLLTASRDDGEDFGTHDVRLLRAFGAQAAMLLERSLLYEEIAAGAVLQERSRLAREIHDGLAQHLAFLKMRVSWLKRSPASVDGAQLRDIEGHLETALIEARHAISTLRSEPHGASAHEAISQYAEEFGQVSAVKVSLIGDERVPELGPKARVELLRVVQEAMNNVRKHAQASEVVVDITEVKGGLQVRIEDNGSGFDVRQTEQGHFGLEIMRERAESVGGIHTITSTPNVGTQVCIWMPSLETDVDTPTEAHLRAVES